MVLIHEPSFGNTGLHRHTYLFLTSSYLLARSARFTECRLSISSEARFSRLLEGCSGTCEARLREHLASQVQSDLRNAVSMGWRRSAYCPTVVGHFDIESTMRYLKPSRSQQIRGKVI